MAVLMSKANNVKCSSYRLKETEPVDYEFIIKVPTMSISPEWRCSKNLKLKFTTQSNFNDVVISADEIMPIKDVGTEVVFYSKAKISCIMSFTNGVPQEKTVKIWLEDHSLSTPKTICYARINLAEVLEECIQERVNNIQEDVNFAHNMGLMSLSITPRKLELREKVTQALTKPPVHTPISKMPKSPTKSPNRPFSEENGQFHFRNHNSEIKIDVDDIKENWNDLSFCTPEGDYQEQELSEGQSHFKSGRKQRSSSQITMKKPKGGMGKRGMSNRPSQAIQRDSLNLLSQNRPLFNGKINGEKREGSSIKNWAEDSISKFSHTSSASAANAFENSIFSTAKKIDKRIKIKGKEQYTPNVFERSERSVRWETEENENKEPPRRLYRQLDEADRIMKLSSWNSEAIFSATNNSVISSVSSFPQFNEKDLVKSKTENIDFVDKYNDIKEKEKKYKKEVKVLKLEKKQLKMKTEDVDKHLQIEADKIIDKAMGKIQDKINSCNKPKLNKLLAKHLIGPLLKVMLASDDKVSPLLEVIKNPSKDTLKSDYSVTPTKSVKSRKDFEQELNIHIDELNERIKQLEIENKALKYDLSENSRLYDAHQNSISLEKQKFEDLKKEIDSKVSEEQKVKEDVNSKITNYKTRIFFLESQIEELENKKDSQIDMATNKLKNKNKQLEKENKKLQKAKEGAEGKLEGLRSKLEEIIESEQQLKKQDKDNKATIKKLQSLIEDLEKKLVELKTEYADKMYELELR